MHRRLFMQGIVAIGFCPLCACAPSFAAEGAHWTYEGATGPDHWGDLDAADQVCGIGSQQSPIDIVAPIPARLPPLVFGWGTRPDTIVNNGHTIRMDFSRGSTLQTGSDRYTLVQFHFHHPAEHLIGGNRSAMEVHFVHTNAAGNAAAVGVLMVPGKPNATFHKIVQTMPATEGPPVKADPAINPNGLLPRRRLYFRYEGSLTIPPCGENIEWSLLRTPIEVAEADIAAFAKIYPMNARPVQKDNRRFVLQSG
jgi:carbonic anhydrase